MKNNEQVAVIVTLHYFYEVDREVEYRHLGRLYAVAPEVLTAGEWLVALSHEVEVPEDVLEDPYENRLEHYLQEQGYEVLGASSQEEFEQVLEQLL